VCSSSGHRHPVIADDRPGQPAGEDAATNSIFYNKKDEYLRKKTK
jgi:hypothetical protein